MAGSVATTTQIRYNKEHKNLHESNTDDLPGMKIHIHLKYQIATNIGHANTHTKSLAWSDWVET